MKHLFVVVEGLDGTGKSSVVRGVAARMVGAGHPAIAIRCPVGDFSLAEPFVRQACTTDARYLFYLSGAKYTSDIVSDLLATQSVVCDRYYYSTVAYHQACGAQIEVDLASLGLRQPDLKFCLTVSDEQVRQTRIASRGEATPGDRVVREPGGVIERIEARFRSFGLKEIDTTSRPLDDVVELLFEEIFHA